MRLDCYYIKCAELGHYHVGEIVKKGDQSFGLIIDSTAVIDGYSYQVQPLCISRNWLIRKIQLWALKKSFQ